MPEHWAAEWHTHIGERITASESKTRKAIDAAIAPFKNEIAQLKQAVHQVAAKQANVDPALSAALRAYIDVMINEALNADAATAAKANKLFVDGLIAKALVPLVARIKMLEVKK